MKSTYACVSLSVCVTVCVCITRVRERFIDWLKFYHCDRECVIRPFSLYQAPEEGPEKTTHVWNAVVCTKTDRAGSIKKHTHTHQADK